MNNKFAFALVALLLGNSPALPSHAESCEGNFCQVSFRLTSQIEQFNIPMGVQSIDFVIAGGSGGRGGQGGKVSGTLTNLPSTIYIVVGGQGQVGSKVAGGYNGGGAAGGFRTNEGSGGGASDIRLDFGLDSRIVVAGGGGGAGGFSGAPGGAGGGEIGGWGQFGQGGGGAPGTQVSGGDAGTANGGSAATAGSFGSGGTGGNSINAGGGGGGGGWFGGGGGGADQDNCCMDGGGGGGGSSFAHPDFTTNIVHEQGVQLGNGFVTFSYTKNLVVTGFSAIQLDSNTAVFDLGLSTPIALTLENFDLSALSCKQSALETFQDGYRIVAIGCADGQQQIRVGPGALDGASPNTELLAALNFDATAPEFSWQDGVVDHQQSLILVPYTLGEGQLLPEQLSVQGCEIVVVGSAQISLQTCWAEAVSISVPVGAFSDEFGNASPAEMLTQSFVLDRIAPSVSVSDLVINHETAEHSFEFQFSEPVDFDVSRILVQPSGCEASRETSQNTVRISGNCGFGRISYVLPGLSAEDKAGNFGPAADFEVFVEIAAPEPPAPIVSDEPADNTAEPGAEPQVPTEETEPSAPTEPAPDPVSASPNLPVTQPQDQLVDEAAPTNQQPNAKLPGEEIEPVATEDAWEESPAREFAPLVPEPAQDSLKRELADRVQDSTVEAAARESEPATSGEQELIAEDIPGFDAVTITATNSPRLVVDPLVSGPNLNLLLISTGGVAVLATTGYVIYRKMMVR